MTGGRGGYAFAGHASQHSDDADHVAASLTPENKKYYVKHNYNV